MAPIWAMAHLTLYSRPGPARPIFVESVPCCKIVIHKRKTAMLGFSSSFRRTYLWTRIWFQLLETNSMTSLGTSKGVLEIAKFAVYVTVPIGLMYFFANNTKNLQKFMGTVSISWKISNLISENPNPYVFWSQTWFWFWFRFRFRYCVCSNSIQS